MVLETVKTTTIIWVSVDRDKHMHSGCTALQDSNGRWILNGDWQVSVFSQTITVRGTALEYSGSDNVIETITSGSVPTKEQLFVQVGL